METRIILEYKNAKTAEAIANAVSPDNFKTPAGLFIRTTKKGSKVSTRIKSEGKLATFIATIDDLLFCASTAEKTLRTTKKLEKRIVL